jgi:uncharacterized protein YoxC
MALFRNMFSTTQNEVLPIAQNIEPTDSRTYQQWGHTQAGRVDASPNALKPCLQATYIEIRKKVAEDTEEQEKRKRPIRTQIAGLEAENVNLQNQTNKATKDLEFEQNKIKQLYDEIAEIKKNPQTLTGDSFAKASFWIGLVIIALLTVYLFVFYSSAAYSAFFKNFTGDDTNIVNSIFDAQAIVKAFNDGFTELILLLTIPAVFLGLGFLIHKFSEQKGIVKYFKIAGLVITTFIFDFIIAYEIVEKIYNIKQQGSFQVMPNMTIGMAVQQINFWLIIFAGFVVYLIWGFVFSFVMEEYEKLDKVRFAIKNKEKKMQEYKSTCKDLQIKIEEWKSHKNSNIGAINKLKIEIESVIFYVKEISAGVDNFFTGWIGYMQGAGKIQSQIDECTVIRDNFKESLNLIHNNNENEDNNN